MRSIQKHPTITSNYLALMDELGELTTRAKRHATSVTLLAVTKTRTAEEIRAAYGAGVRDVGENYLQEALPKRDALNDLQDLTWHFIGGIQSNKTTAIAQHFDWVHTVDRQKIAQRLDRARPPELGPLNVCISVNLHNETGKFGAAPSELSILAASIQDCPRLRLRGLMAIPDADVPPTTSFEMLAQLYHQLPDPPISWDSLSMGMSGDYAAAIAAGSTMVRIGTALFGPRPPKIPD